MHQLRLFHWTVIGSVLMTAASASAQDDAPQPEELFRQLDQNDDGTLTADEVGPDRKRFFDRAVRVGDENGDGQLTLKEFTAGLKDEERRPGNLGDGNRNPRGRNPAPMRLDVDSLFKNGDTNGDGKLTRDELPESMRRRMEFWFRRLQKDELTKEDFSRVRFGFGGVNRYGALFDRLDVDKDGKLTRDEVPENLTERLGGLFDQTDKKELTREEFIRGLSNREGANRSRAFGFSRTADQNRDGQLSKEELTRAVEQFDRLDANRNGSLEAAELFGAQRSDSNSSTERTRTRQRNLSRFFQQMDKNSDNKLSREEFPPTMRERFDTTDQNSDGFVDMEEMQRVGIFGRLPSNNDGGTTNPTNDAPGNRERNFSRFFQQLDQNGDDKLSREELPQTMRERWERLDQNSDGFIDQEEMRSVGGFRPRSDDGSSRPRPDRTNRRPRRPESDD